MSKQNFNEEYYKSINYTDYLQRSVKYEKMSEEIDWFFRQKINVINQDSYILDYGCAVGFLIEALNKLSYKHIYGFEISDYAKEICKQKNLSIIENVNETKYDLVFFLDVLEHMNQSDIDNLFAKNKFGSLIVRIPCAAEENKNIFYLDVSRKDKTHINCKTKNEWIETFKNYGYKKIITLNLNTIYDSKGVFCALIL